MIVQHLTRNGVMDVGQLYESPFNSLVPAGPEQLFREDELNALDSVLRRFSETTRAS
jgi:type I restriction enzyme R subunit